jgi:hypothetical protein
MILTILDDMKLDLANFRLRSLRPVLQKQAVDYERSKFEAALKAGAVQLTKTKRWLTASKTKADETIAARNPENVFHPDNRAPFDAIYFDALLSTIFNNDKLVSTEDCPETFAMDIERLMSLQNEAQAITVIAAIAMLSKNFIPELRDETSALETLKQQLFILMEHPETTIEHLAMQVVAVANQVLQRYNKSVTEKQTEMIKNMVEKTMAHNDTVFSLLNRRIQRSVQQQLTSGNYKKDSSSGFEVVEKEVEALSQKIFHLAKFNRDVYAPWYDSILNGEH